MAIAREEIFGPVVCVMMFKTFDEAIERADATTYSLAAGVCTMDVENIMHCAPFLQAGHRVGELLEFRRRLHAVWRLQAEWPRQGTRRAGTGAIHRDQSNSHCTEGALGEELV
ncbi:aldehyde dehydrogenase, mitochondrial precursor [Trypanosoma rangeli]|uniref:Aldehyde dehydrogenase, mitochondrial n=1 Tax=Trypanosoma rangeli TaxID=5698 RepID=A0A3R7RS28_TRYRA|nr:aldehyde dehydrogenase, mitochondrial precursor [Trypanosoma rangeli]RNF11735.1 aldehyde dehydrogenase, mitochondrial precursor [Trypanosoma rangeli]|eukprot:RNF11735.1 aldehyde dehydrogenase, mitochondrial precursor [Trypanosoma rangeli]